MLALAAFCFWPALSGPFVFDDFPNLQNLQQVAGEPSLASIGRYLYYFNGNPGRPLSALSFLIEDAAWPAYPADFKRNNLMLHLLVGVVVFVLARMLAALARAEPRKAGWIALACTAIWLLQPMQLSATMLVVQRMNILAGLLVLLGLLVYLKIVCSERANDLVRVLAAGATLAGFAVLAILCKENGILIFAYATALNFTLLGPRIDRYARGARWLLLCGAAAPMLLLAGLVVARPEFVLDPYSWREFSLGERLLTEPRILFDYFRMILLPRVGGQGVFHDDYVISRSLWDPASTALALLALAGFVFSAFWLRRRFPIYAFAVLWFLAGHLLESTVIALELYFEHRNYLPMIGPLFALTYLLFKIAVRHRALAAASFFVWVGLCATLTYYNAGIWGDRGKLALTWLAERPDSVRAVQMAASYYSDIGNQEEARRLLEDGYARMPRLVELRFQSVLLDCYVRGVAKEDLQALIRLAATAHNSRTIPDVVTAFRIQSLEGGCHGTVSNDDIRALIAALLSNPQYARHDDVLGTMHYELSRFELSEGDLDGLIEELDLTHKYRPNPMVLREAAIYLLSAGLPDTALEYLERSENTSLPWLKATLLDIRTANVPLRQSAERIRKAQHGPANDAKVRSERD